MDIREEYARLCSFAQSKEKWQEIENQWLVASGYVCENGHWLKKRVSAGGNVTGFALDLKTWAYRVGSRGCDHEAPKLDLVLSIAKKENIAWEEVGSRVVEGRAAHCDLWNFPLITFIGLWIFREPDLLKELEEKVLELKIGHPISSLSKKFQV